MNRTHALSFLVALFAACGGPQTTRMELRSNEQVQIAQLMGCNDYDIEETDGGSEGNPSRSYSVSCDGSSETSSITCADGAGCQIN